jgi:hypothetical protein
MPVRVPYPQHGNNGAAPTSAAAAAAFKADAGDVLDGENPTFPAPVGPAARAPQGGGGGKQEAAWGGGGGERRESEQAESRPRKRSGQAESRPRKAFVAQLHFRLHTSLYLN